MDHPDSVAGLRRAAIVRAGSHGDKPPCQDYEAR